MGVIVDADKVIDEYLKEGGTTTFKDSLKQVLEWAGEDDNLKKVEHLAYLLGTAKVESDYSLQRWESDWQCKSIGVPYKEKPCQKAINYFCSTQGGKANYCNLGLDKRGLPYFGRGLIQLTGKANYEKYGKLIGKDLVKNPELALEPRNSFKIATTYMATPKGSSGNNTFDWVEKGDLTQARKSVNGGTRDLDKVNQAYKTWLNILKDNAEIGTKKASGGNATKRMVTIGVALATIGVTGIIVYFVLKKTGKLPNFLKKVNL